MSLFNGKYLSDEDIWEIINGIIQERDEIKEKLARPEISTNPDIMPELAIRMHRLDALIEHFNELQGYCTDLKELEELINEETDELHKEELLQLYEEYKERCSSSGTYVYQLLLKKGYLNIEQEDEKDLEILQFLNYAGAEYPWRLSINIGIDVVEARERLEVLLEKGLIEKVQGTMLEGYHRQKDWVKHMNHTYYRISRKGKHYLRGL
ncbi:DUF2250 domain-containing protein [Desulfolucanica intricata]|uniref:DUF2250 domain-containing protein n=1 Tax=Desulfolucanica intricata TaxID=1285191 RepID=UPI0009EE0B0B|nr:DUF2250 domain-containing protein [Desulfolucanica intricata]